MSIKFGNTMPWQLKLVALMLLMAILPGFLISYGIIGLIKDELKSNIDNTLIYSSNSVASDIDSKLSTSFETLGLINKIIENPNLGSDEKIAFMVSSIQKVNNLLSLSLYVKEDGKFVSALSTQKDEIQRENNQVIPIDSSFEKFDVSILNTESSLSKILLTPRYNPKTKTWYCWSILKSNMPKLPSAYLVAQLDLSDVAKDMESQMLNRIGILFVSDSTGTKFLSSKLFVDVPKGIMKDAGSLLKNNTKVILKKSYEESGYGNYVACFSYPRSARWVVVSTVEEKSAYATVNEAFLFFLIFACISAGLSVIIALLFSKHLSKPIVRMARVSEEIAGGNFTAKTHYKANDSIGLLNNSLSKMGSQLKSDFEKIENQKNQLEDYSKNLEKKVEERTIQLSESNAELKKAYQRVLELNEEKNEFLGIAAHDLKNPLIAVSSFAEILKDEKDLTPDQHNDFLDEIVKASSRMFFIIKNLLDVNAIEQGKLNSKLEKVLVYSIGEELALQFQEALASKELKLIKSCEDKDCYIRADYTLTMQVLQNLLSNAIKFSPRNKKIYFTVAPSKDKRLLEIKIKDEGPGFTEEDKKKLFGKFARLSARPTSGEDSTGLGLSIVKKLVEMMNGKIRLESESGKGAEFILSFPRNENGKETNE